jgi:hypothetical protein
VCNHTPNNEEIWRCFCCFCLSVYNHFW